MTYTHLKNSLIQSLILVITHVNFVEFTLKLRSIFSFIVILQSCFGHSCTVKCHILLCHNPLEYKQVKFGVMKKDCSQQYMVNNLFLFAKYFINKCRFLKTPPSFPHFINDLRAFASSLCTISNEKASRVAKFFNEISDL